MAEADDIVSRLRSWVAYDKNGGYPQIRTDCLRDIDDAAAEVERLRDRVLELEAELELAERSGGYGI